MDDLDFLDGLGDVAPEDNTLLARLGYDLAEKRDAAIRARKDSGIEDIWTTCEESYLAIDESNRREFAGAKWAKPTSMTGGITADYGPSNKNSSAFVRLTSRYVDMGASKIADILLPIDDKPFAIKATPVPDLVNGKDNMTDLLHPMHGRPMMRPATAEEIAKMPPPPPAAPNAPPPPPPMVRMSLGDLAKHALEEAEKAAEKAETRIYDWLTEANFAAEMRKVIHDSARIGVGVLKAPTVVMQKSMAMSKIKEGMALEIKFKAVPSVKWLDPWNLFPHGACGEDVSQGDHVWERDFLSPTQIKALKADDTYMADQIDKVLKEGPDKMYTEGRNPNEKKNKDRYEVWYFTGQIKRSDMMLTKAIGLDELPDEVNDVHAICTLINDSVVRAVINPMQSGSFNYHTMPWSRRAGHWAGVGVGEQVSMPQRMVNAGTRALLNNGGLSAGLQFVMDPLAIVPADGDSKITPNKLWYKSADSSIDDVRKAFIAIEFPNVGQQMMNIIQYAFKLAEEASNIPLIAQGQTTEARTFGEAELMNSNANTLLRNIALSFDDHITTPVVQGFYEWLLLDPSVPNDEKGDFKIDAKGSLALVEKAIQEQTIPQILQVALNPAYRIDPKRTAQEFLRSKRLDPRKYQFSDEEQDKMDKQQPPPPLPLLVEQVRQQGAMQQLQGKAQADMQHLQGQAQIDMQLQQAKMQGELQMAGADMQAEQTRLSNGQATPHMAMASAKIEQERIRASTALMVEQSRAHAEMARADKEVMVSQQNGDYNLRRLELEREIALLDYANKEKINLNDAKMMLAKSAMDNRTKRELAAAEIQLAQNENQRDRELDLHKHNTNSLVRDEMSTKVTP